MDLTVGSSGASITVPLHDDAIKWKHFPRYWPLVRENTGPVTQSFDVFFDLHLKKKGCVNHREFSDLRRHRAHVMLMHRIQYLSHIP